MHYGLSLEDVIRAIRGSNMEGYHYKPVVQEYLGKLPHRMCLLISKAFMETTRVLILIRRAERGRGKSRPHL